MSEIERQILDLYYRPDEPFIQICPEHPWKTDRFFRHTLSSPSMRLRYVNDTWLLPSLIGLFLQPERKCKQLANTFTIGLTMLTSCSAAIPFHGSHSDPGPYTSEMFTSAGRDRDSWREAIRLAGTVHLTGIQYSGSRCWRTDRLLPWTIHAPQYWSVLDQDHVGLLRIPLYGAGDRCRDIYHFKLPGRINYEHYVIFLLKFIVSNGIIHNNKTIIK